jgi:putative DNA primase/helicase
VKRGVGGFSPGAVHLNPPGDPGDQMQALEEDFDYFGEDPQTDPIPASEHTKDQIARAVDALIEPGALLELRAKTRKGNVSSGVYSDRAAFLKKARDLSWDTGVEAVWLNLQVIRPDYPTSPLGKSTEAVKDSDIVAWRYIFIDVDTYKAEADDTPTDEDKNAALADAKAVKKLLLSYGIDCFTADSGNGFHVLVPFRAPRSEETDRLVKRFVQSVAQLAEPRLRGSSIDVSVANPGRVCKLYGTETRKGNDASRWRKSELRSTTNNVTTREQLQAVIASAPAISPDKNPQTGDRGFDSTTTPEVVEGFMAAYGVRHSRRLPFAGNGYKWFLKDCPLGHHKESGTKTIVTLNNGIGFKCLAGKCASANWHQLRAHLEKGGIKYSFSRPESKAAPTKPRSIATTSDAAESYELEVLRLSDVIEKPITWLWPGFIPRGKLTLLAGAPGTAKSTMSIDFAATLTRGGTWPDRTLCRDSGDCLFWSSEDGVEDTIKPRLVAAGADCERVYIPKVVRAEGQEPRPFDPSCDMPQIRKLMERYPNIKLLVIDPIISAVTGDMHRANDVRHALQEIVDFAEDFNVSVLGITHFAKNSGGKNPTERVLGSQAFGAFARMVLVTAKDETTGECVVTRSKSNITTDTGGYRYSLEVVSYPDATGRTIETTKIGWGEPIEGSSRTILAEIEGGDSEPSKVDMAKEFLHKEFSRQNTQQSKAIISKAKEHGLGETSVRKAATQLGVRIHKTGFAGGWSWSYAPKMMDEDGRGLLM